MKKQIGFALLEVMMAVVIMIIISYGVVYLFGRGSDQSNLVSTEQELNSIAYTFSQLAGSGLTQSVNNDSSLVSLLYDSRQLSLGFFTTDTSGNRQLSTSFGALTFSSVNAGAFDVSFSIGLTRTETEIAGFMNTVQDNYTCSSGCGATYAGEITLSYNLSN